MIFFNNDMVIMNKNRRCRYIVEDTLNLTKMIYLTVVLPWLDCTLSIINNVIFLVVLNAIYELMYYEINMNHQPTLWALKNSLMLMLSLLSVSISLKSASSSSVDNFRPESFIPSVNSFRLKPLLPSSSILRKTLHDVK